jgi:putative ABC transport system permease protein
MITFLIKGLLRDRSRSLVPLLMAATGVFLTVLLYSYLQGVLSEMVRVTARFDTGHVKLTTSAYAALADQLPNDLALLDADALTDSLRREWPDMLWTSRIRFGGLLDVPDTNGETRAQGPMLGLGVDLRDPRSPEHAVLRLDQAVMEGRMPQAPDEVLISRDFARKLGVAAGQTATLMGSTMNGSMTVYNFKVAGLVQFGITALDRACVIADIRDVRLALDMSGAASEIVGYARDMQYRDGLLIARRDAYNARSNDRADEFLPVMQTLGQQHGLAELLRIIGMMGTLIVLVFVGAMSLVLWNSGLMNNLRRYGEIGVRLALGEGKGALYRRMVAESFCIGLAGSILGTLLGLAVAYFLQEVGFNIGRMMQKSTILMSDVIRARITPVSFVIGFVPGTLAPVLGALCAGLGIYRRQTAQLFKELEV